MYNGFMPRVTHFEVYADDLSRAKKFYSEIFGWKFDKANIPWDYWMAYTGKDKQPGINGGLMKRMQGRPNGMINYIDVSSIDEFSKKIKASGGKIIKPKTQIPGVGIFAIWHGYRRKPLFYNSA